jgi:hypothetical protein
MTYFDRVRKSLFLFLDLFDGIHGSPWVVFYDVLS